MTTGDISQTFNAMFDATVKEAYQRNGPLLLPCVRQKTVLGASSIQFVKTGTGTAGAKGRHAVLPKLNLDHTPAIATMADYGLSELIDKLDEMKTNIPERMVVANAIAKALGRRVDQTIITAADAAVTATSYSTTITMTSSVTIKNAWILARQALAERFVPTTEGGMYAIVSPSIFSALMELDQFANSQWTGSADVFPNANLSGRTWMGAHWIEHTGLTKSTNTRKGFFLHKEALGLGMSQEPTTDIQWDAERWTNVVAGVVSVGAVAIDSEGIQGLSLDESVTLPTS